MLVATTSPLCSLRLLSAFGFIGDIQFQKKRGREREREVVGLTHEHINR